VAVGRFDGLVVFADDIAPLLEAHERPLFFRHVYTGVGVSRLYTVESEKAFITIGVGEAIERFLTGGPLVDGEKYLLGVAATGTPWSWGGRLDVAISHEMTCLLITDRRLLFVSSGIGESERRVLAEVPRDEVARARRRWKCPMVGSVEIWFTDESMIAVGLGWLCTRKARRVVRLLNE
jgi:hypothetical protein